MTKFVNPELDYAFDQLEPYVSKETMYFHHDKHLQGYIDNLNKLIKGTDLEDSSLEDIVKLSTGGVFNNAAQSFNHIFFFDELSPSPKLLPEGDLARCLESDFGCFDCFKSDFMEASMAQFGSGWAWLSMANDGRLIVTTTSNAETPINQNLTPLMTIDLWEHAYYIDYRNRRMEYLENIWSRINWAVIEKRFSEAQARLQV